MALNKYCNLDGNVKIREDYTKINIGFEKVEIDATKNTQDIAALKNVTYTGSEHDALVTSALVDVDGEDFGPDGNQTYLQGRLNKWENRIKPLDNGIINTPTISFGVNIVKHTGKVPVPPTIKFKGMSYVNLLGKDGDCEDVSKWTAMDTPTLTLDTTNKVFGTNGIKIAIGAGKTIGQIYKRPNGLMSTGKYYLFSAYIKNGNGAKAEIYWRYNNGVVNVTKAVESTDTSKFVRVGVLISSSDYADLTTFTYCDARIDVTGTEGQYGYVDGIMFSEITAADYAAGADACLAKYPYVESYGCLTNPYFENRRYNLVKNGNCEEGIGWWNPKTPSGTVTLAIVNDKLQVTSGGQYGAWQTVTVKPNTNYYIKFNASSGTVSGKVGIFTLGFATILTASQGTFNSGANMQVIVYLWNQGAGTCSYDSVMLIEGTTAPAEYLSCDPQEYVVEGEFADGDEVEISDGKPSGQLWNKHKTLFGKDYDWQFFQDFSGHKSLQIPTFITRYNALPEANSVNGLAYIEKYDGKILGVGTSTQADAGGTTLIANNLLLISVSDLDSGWAEAINPNADETKAFMNGWKAIGAPWLNRYVCFINIIDGSAPSGVANTTASGVNASGQAVVNVVSTAGFLNGDYVSIQHDDSTWGLYIIATVNSATQITLQANLSVALSTSNKIIKSDDGTNTAVVTWCKNNVAPNYEGYRLHYKLANPEPITDANVHVHGDIWSIVPGDNYINVDSGIVLGEVANPWYYAPALQWLFNNTYASSTNYSRFKSKTEDILAVYKNNNFDSTFVEAVNETNAYGRNDGYILNANFNPNGVYTVDYQILKTLHAQSFGSLTMSYGQDIVTSIEGIAKAVEGKQKHDSALDTLVDLSMYERLYAITTMPVTYFTIGSTMYLGIQIPIQPKNCIPTIKINQLNLNKCTSTGTVNIINLLSLSGIAITNNMMIIYYALTDSTAIADIKAYGAYLTRIDIELDCIGRV